MHMNPKTTRRTTRKSSSNVNGLLLPPSKGGHSTFAFGAARKAAPRPAPPLRITAVGLRTCEAGTTLALLSLASGVTDERVAEGQAPGGCDA